MTDKERRHSVVIPTSGRGVIPAKAGIHSLKVEHKRGIFIHFATGSNGKKAATEKKEFLKTLNLSKDVTITCMEIETGNPDRLLPWLKDYLLRG